MAESGLQMPLVSALMEACDCQLMLIAMLRRLSDLNVSVAIVRDLYEVTGACGHPCVDSLRPGHVVGKISWANAKECSVWLELVLTKFDRRNRR